MLQTAHGWELDVERGPGWLFVRLHGATRKPSGDRLLPLGKVVLGLLEQQFAHRLVLELELVGKLDNTLIDELVWLERRIHAEDGLMRICGLRPSCRKALEKRRLSDRFPDHANREEAVMGRSRNEGLCAELVVEYESLA